MDRGATDILGAPARCARGHPHQPCRREAELTMADELPTRVVIERILPATPGDVFAAWTTAEILRTFMCPGDVTEAHVDLDPRVGGRFRIVMRAGGRDLDHHGEYRVLEPGRRIVFTWASAATAGRETLV